MSDTAGPLEILVVSWNYPPRQGGAEEMVRRLVAGLSAEARVCVLTGRLPSGPSDPTIENLTVRRAPLPGIAGFLAWLVIRFPMERFGKGFAVALSSGALIGSLVEILCRVSRRPHAILHYGTDFTYPNRLYQAWLRLVLPTRGLALTISRYVREEAEARGYIAKGRSAMLVPGIAPEIRNLPARAPAPRSERPVLLSVGRLVPRKGLTPFLENCFPSIVKVIDTELWIVGGEATQSLAHEGGELARIQAAIQTGGLEDRVRLFGRLDDPELRGAYRSASLFVLPGVPIAGDVEGFGMVLLEAALFGVPSVAARIGGIPDAVVDGETGLLVPPEDWEGFAKAVIALLTDARLRDRLAAEATRRALAEFDWATISQRCGTLLRNLAE